MIVSFTFELNAKLDGGRAQALLDRLCSVDWQIHTSNGPNIVGYISSEALLAYEYDLELKKSNFEAVRQSIPDSFKLLSIGMDIPWRDQRQKLAVDLVIDNEGSTLGIDVSGSDLEDVQNPERERENMRFLVNAAKPILVQIGVTRGAIGMEADVRSELIGLDWRLWPPHDIKHVEPRDLLAVQKEAYLFEDLGELGCFVAMTPLLQHGEGPDFDRRMHILDRAFGSLPGLFLHRNRRSI